MQRNTHNLARPFLLPRPPCWKVHAPTVLFCGDSLSSSNSIAPPATIMALMSTSPSSRRGSSSSSPNPGVGDTASGGPWGEESGAPSPCPSPSSLTPFSWMGVSNRHTYLHMCLHTINGMHAYKQVIIIHTHKLIRSLHTVHTYVHVHRTASDQRWGVSPTSCWMCCDFCCSTWGRADSGFRFFTLNQDLNSDHSSQLIPPGNVQLAKTHT